MSAERMKIRAGIAVTPMDRLLDRTRFEAVEIDSRICIRCGGRLGAQNPHRECDSCRLEQWHKARETR